MSDSNAMFSGYDAVEMGLRKGDIDDDLMEREDGDGGGDCSDQESIWEFVMIVFSEVQYLRH